MHPIALSVCAGSEAGIFKSLMPYYSRLDIDNIMAMIGVPNYNMQKQYQPDA
jgi:hypothetical protein